MVVALVIVLGFALVVYARQSRPAADASDPQVGDHWHVGYGFNICGEWIQVEGDAEERDANGNDLVVKLNYGLYGLKQGARSWNATFHKTLIKLGFTRSQYEPCLYMKNSTWIYVYVDDLIVIAPTDAEVDDLHA